MAAEREFDLANIDGTNGIVIGGGNDFEDTFATNYAGYVVRGAGDVNGDGFGDIIVSINDSVSIAVRGVDVDESYVVFGSDSGFENDLALSDLEDSDGSRGFVVKGDEAASLSGFSVDGAGDVNGDGVDDFVVGDYSADPNGEDSGASYVVFGRTTGFGSELDLTSLAGSDGSLGFAINGAAAGDSAGRAVSSAGDVNGDGVDDFILSAYSADANGENSGESYVIFGNRTGFDSTLDLADLDETVRFAIAGLNAGDRLGISVSDAGDINGDGIADVVVGAYGANESFVVFGSAEGFGDRVDLASLDGSNGFTVSGTGNFTSLAGDVNGDGIDDLALSTGRGESYVVFGSAQPFGSTLNLQSLDGANGFAIDGGNAISGAGDFNGDGLDDVVVGSPGGDGGNGESYVIFGSAAGFDETFELSSVNGLNGLVISGLTIQGRGGNAGYSVGSAEDFNGDGFDDLLIGTTLPRYDSFDRRTRGPDEVYVVFGRSNGEGAIALNDDLSTDEDTPLSGNVLANDTSVSPDRVDSLSVTAVNGAAANVGTQITLDSGALLKIQADGSFDYDPNGRFERLNNNAINVESFSYTVTDGVATDTGTVNVTVNGITDSPTGTPSDSIFDLADLDGSNGFVIALEDTFGYSSVSAVSGIGDINGDGFDDAIAANYIIFGSQEGFGGELSPQSLDGSNGFTLSGAIAEDGGEFDIDISSVSGAGDVNGDGIDDFVVGDAGFESFAGPSRPGRSYVVFGSANGFDSELDLTTLDGTNGFIFEDGNESDQFGFSVGGAGDINADGIDDLIVGAPFSNPFGASTGKSFVLFGKTSGFERKLNVFEAGESALDGSNGFVLNGVDSSRYSGDRAGASVDGAGDINGDGIDDVVIGAPGGNESYVVFGSSQGFDSALDLVDLDGRNGFTISGIQNQAGAGISVSSAGDINGDGIDDVVIGDEGSNYSNDPGKSYVVFGSAAGFRSRLDVSTLNGSNGFAITSEEAKDGLGRSVSQAGDINNDGIDDLIVGSSSLNRDDNSPSDSYVIYGSTAPFGSNLSVNTLDGRDGFVIEGGGRAVSSAGDFNGDGTADIIIGERLSDAAGTIDSTAYLVYGPALGNTPQVKAQQDTFTTDSDTVVSGNVFLDNGSGADTLPAGTTLTFNATEANGTQVTLPSGALLTLRADGTFDYDPNGQFDNLGNFDTATDSFSYTLSQGTLENTATVTINIDGAFETPTPSTAFNAVLDVSSLDGRDGFTLTNQTTDSSFGRLVGDAGDVNGDGIGDVVLGVSGSPYVLFGSNGGFGSTLDISALDGSNGFAIDVENFNYSASNAGDVNGDGFDDIILGTDTFLENSSGYVVFGKAEGFDAALDVSTLDGSNGLALRREGTGSVFNSGPAVSGIGDVNGDGLDDFILAAATVDDSYSERSANYIVFGNSEGFESTLELAALDGTDGFVLRGEEDFTSVESFSSELGDVNGDGLDDFIISNTTSTDSQTEVTSYVVFGSNSGFDSDLTLSGLDGSNGFVIPNAGRSVSSAGDINGDDLDDIVVQFNYDVSGNNKLAAVVFGSTEGFESTINLNELRGDDGFAITAENNSFNPYSVSQAGDINGDGLDDLLLGSSRDGNSYIIFGSQAGFDSQLNVANLDGQNGFEISGIEGSSSLRAISGAGDINGDGIDDVIIGSSDADLQGTSSGAGYVIYGRATVPTESLNPVSGGTAGNDGITGTAAADQIEGLAGNDVLDGKQGDDVLDGGEGTDTALYQFDPAGVVVDLSSGIATDGFGDTDTLASIENIIGSDFDDTLKGNEGANNLTGGKGQDTLEGGLGDDTLLGGNSADRLLGGEGADSFLYVSIAEGGDTIEDFETGTDKVLIVGAIFDGGLSNGELSAERFFTGAEATSASHRLGYNPSTGELLFDADGSGDEGAQRIATLADLPAISSADITVV